MADYKLRVEVDEQELTKKLVKAFKEATKGFSDTFKGGSSGGMFSGLNQSADEYEKSAEAMLDLKKKMAVIDEASKTHAHKLAMTLEKQTQHRQTLMKLLAKENELLRRSGGHSGRAGSLIGGLVGGRAGSAGGAMFDQLRSMWSGKKDRENVRSKMVSELENSRGKGTITQEEFEESMKEIEENRTLEKKARPMMLVGIGAGLLAGAGMSKLIIDSSPLLQAMLKLLNVGIMLILRPIGDFIGFLLRPLLIEFVKKVAIPAYKGGAKLAKKWGDSLGKGLLGLIHVFTDPIGAIVAAIHGGLNAFFGNNPENTSMLAGMTYPEGERPEGALTPIEFIGAEQRDYSKIPSAGTGGGGGISFHESLMQPLMTFLGKMNAWFLGTGATMIDNMILHIGTFLGKLTAAFSSMKNVPDYLKLTMTGFFNKIQEVFMSVNKIINNVFANVGKSLSSAWLKMSEFFKTTIPDKFKTLGDDIAKAFKGVPKKLADIIVRTFDDVMLANNPIDDILTNPKKVGPKGGSTGWNPLKDIQKWFQKPNSPAGLGSSTMSIDDIIKALKGALKSGVKSVGPQMAGEMVFWNLIEPYVLAQDKGYADYMENRDKAGDNNWELIKDFFSGQDNGRQWQFPGAMGTNNTSPTGGNQGGTCPFMAYACTGDFGELISDDFKEIKEHTEATNGSALDILSRWQNMGEDMTASQGQSSNIKTSSITSAFNMLTTEGHFNDIEKNAGSAASMMSSLVEKVTSVLARANIQSKKDDATGSERALGNSGAYDSWIKDTEGNIQAPNSKKYFIAWYGPDGKSTGHTTTQTLSPAAYSYYKNLHQTGQIKTLHKLAKGGILNEPVLGFGQKTGKGYLMGESGPEAVVPLNGKGGSTGGNTFNITINASNVQDVERQLKPTILRLLKESTSRAGIV